MSLVLADRVRQTSTTTGSGTFTLDGSVTGFQSFAAVGNGNTTYYTITLDAQWEVGIGTYSAGTLTRDTVISSSTGSKIAFAAGVKDVFVSMPAEKTVLGPDTATDHALARYNGTTGKIVQNSAVTITDAGNMAGAQSVQFSGDIPVSTPIGTMWFDAATDTLNFKQNNITQQVGEEIFVYGRASEAITNGQVVAVSGAYGTTGYVTMEPAPIGTSDPTHIIGLATEDIPKNGFGRITAFGIVHDLSTSPGYADGDALWYDPTVLGGYTKIQPTAPNIKVQIGVMTKAAGGTNGSIQVKVINNPAINDVSNIQTSSVANGQVLTYYQAGGYWRNEDSSAKWGA